MEYVSGSQTNGMPMPPGVTAITDIKSQKRANKTLSKAVSLHLEGKLEGAARLLSKAIDDGERDIGLYAALGHIQYEMHDYEAAAQTYAALCEIDPKRRPRVSTWAFATVFSSVGATRQRHSAALATPTPRASIPCSGWASR